MKNPEYEWIQNQSTKQKTSCETETNQHLASINLMTSSWPLSIRDFVLWIKRTCFNSRTFVVMKNPQLPYFSAFFNFPLYYKIEKNMKILFLISRFMNLNSSSIHYINLFTIVPQRKNLDIWQFNLKKKKQQERKKKTHSLCYDV